MGGEPTGKVGDCVVILVGGESRRMGRDKAGLPLGEATFLESLSRRMSERFSTSVVVARDEQRRTLAMLPGIAKQIHWVSDKMLGRGPLEGLVSGIEFLVDNQKVAADDWIFVVPVDMPLVDRNLADHLIAAADETSDCLMPATGSRKLGFPLWLRSRAAGPLRKALGQGLRRVLEIDQECETRLIDLSGMVGEGGVGESLWSINTKEEYRKLIERQRRPETDEWSGTTKN